MPQHLLIFSKKIILPENKHHSLFKKSTNLPKIVQEDEEVIQSITNNSFLIDSSEDTLPWLASSFEPDSRSIVENLVGF
jgi:hypothetical protein